MKNLIEVEHFREIKFNNISVTIMKKKFNNRATSHSSQNDVPETVTGMQ